MPPSSTAISSAAASADRQHADLTTREQLYSRRPISPIAFFFVSVISFIVGVVSTSVMDIQLPSRLSTSPTAAQLDQSAPAVAAVAAVAAVDIAAAEPPAPQPEPAKPIADDLPLGLRWYKQAYQNPWSFSVLRTGVFELSASATRVMQRDGGLPRVVVSFTSLPKRFVRHAHTMVHLIKQQTYLPDQIYIAVPTASRRSDSSFTIPKWMTSDPLITVLRPPVDYGPATKLIPALEEELRLGNENTRIITVDDDNEGGWAENAVLQLLAYSLHFEDAAIGLTGWNVTCMVSEARCQPADTGVPQRQFRDRNYNFVRGADDYACHSLSDWLPDYFSNCMGAIRKNYVGFIDVIEGYKGALYQPRFFDVAKLKEIVDNTRTPEYFLLCDDVWFSGWLSVRNTSRLVINPAIHNDAPVRVLLMQESDKRPLSRNVAAMTVNDQKAAAALKDVEVGLHSLGKDFVKANHEGVRWFQQHNAWTPDLWKRPPNFKYPTEVTSDNGDTNDKSQSNEQEKR